MATSPIQWAIAPLKKYATFSGRASRAEFWWFTLFVTLINFALWAVLIGSLGGALASQSEPGAGLSALMGGAGIILLLFWLTILIPSFAVQTRRLHDIGRSGWWLVGFYGIYAVTLVIAFGSVGAAAVTGSADASLGALGVSMILNFIWLIYAVVLLVFYIQPGTKGSNEYGSDPYGDDYEKVFE